MRRNDTDRRLDEVVRLRAAGAIDDEEADRLAREAADLDADDTRAESGHRLFRVGLLLGAGIASVAGLVVLGEIL